MKGRVLVIAGSDSGGGAGIQADIKTVTALGGYAATAVTALTAQNTEGVFGVVPVAAEFIVQQIDLVLGDIGADCVKTGMLHSAEVIGAVTRALDTAAPGIPRVVDPVMVAKGGAALLEDSAVGALRSLLIPSATVITPNLPEAETLLGRPIPDADAMAPAARDLLALGPDAVLLKGGHLSGDEIVDVLVSADGIETFTGSRIITRHTHGTGCTLASAIAIGLAQGMPLRDAVARARAYVAEAIRRAPRARRGAGPRGNPHPVGGGGCWGGLPGMKGSRMKIGFGVPTRGDLGRRDAMKAIAERGEALGFDSLWVTDHIVVPRRFAPNYPYAADGRPTFPAAYLEQLTALAWLAATTEKVRLITSVMVVPHRNPVHAAKALATIDVLSAGRLTLGCGAGWMAEEFAAIGTEPFAERGRVTDEYIRIFRELWASDEPSFDGGYARFSDIVFEPKPVQRSGIPIWIGGESGRALRRVAELGDGWMPIGANPKFPLYTLDRYRAGLDRLAAACDEAGRDPASVTRAYFAVWPSNAPPFAADAGERFLCTGTARQIADDINGLVDLGVEHLLLNFARPTLDETLAEMEHFAAEVRPLLAG